MSKITNILTIIAISVMILAVGYCVPENHADTNVKVLSGSGGSINANIGDSCSVAGDCPSDAVCIGHCDCKNGFVPKNDNTGCLHIQLEIGDPCEQIQQCTNGKPGSLSNCTDGECACNDNAIHTEGDHECRPKATYVGEECVTTAQCFANLGNALCATTKTCLCHQEHVPSRNNRTCLAERDLGEQCISSELQCDHIEHAECVPDSDPPVYRCNCKIGYIPHGQKTCLKLATQIDEECTENDQCMNLEGTTCRDNKCSCRADEIGNSQGNKCLPKVSSLNSTCDDSTQCTVRNSDCIKDPASEDAKICLCASGYVEGQNPGTVNTCIQQKLMGEECDEDVQCSKIGIDATVKCDRVCVCPRTTPPSQFHNGRCVRPHALNDTCNSHDECQVDNQLAVCAVSAWSPSQRICICHAEHIMSSGKCWAQLKVDSPCSRDEECRKTIYGSVRCSAGNCTCDPGYTADLDGSRCIPGRSSTSIIGESNTLLIFLITIISVEYFK